MLIRNDIYTGYGSAKLWNCWTPNVTKFDTSSFYNFEQDDEPLYDLEERTYLLWEKLGHPTSSLPGIALVVSADAPASVTGCNKNIFTTVSAAINSLPAIINYPVLVEVCNFGNLGTLDISNKIFGKNGSLEIINRVFGHNHEIAYFDSAGQDLGLNGINYEGTTGYYISSVVGNIPFTAYSQMFSSSAISISSMVLSGATDIQNGIIVDTRLSGNLNGIVTINSHIGDIPVTVSLRQNPAYLNSYLNTTAYELSPDGYEQLELYDVSSYDEVNNVIYPFSNYIATATVAAAVFGGVYPGIGLFYGNSLQKIKVKNCNGPIYLRNFFVDGSGYTGNIDYGFDIQNSEIFLENCASIRCKKAGFLFDNSRVTISRGLVAYRNYDFDSDGNRLCGKWNDKKLTDTSYVSSSGYIHGSHFTKGDSAGILAVNSNIFVSSTSAHFTSLAAADGKYSSYTTSAHINPHDSYVFNFSRNDIGIKLVNSKLGGGWSISRNYTQYRNILDTMNIDVGFNTEHGILLENSEIDWDGFIKVSHNFRGITLNNSIMNIEKLSAWYNQRYGIKAIKSNITYNKNLLKYPIDTAYQLAYQYDFSGNGQHMILDNSRFETVEGSSVASSGMGIIKFHNSHGITNKTFDNSYTFDAGLLPSVSIKNNSFAKFLNTLSNRTYTFLPNSNVLKGGCAEVVDGSKATFVGSTYAATRIIGPTTYLSQDNKVALYAGNNSVINIEGPTVIAQYAIDALAEDGSKINITPVYDNDGRLDIYNYNLSDAGSHTMVELHSTRACLVANRGSEINLKDLGDFTTNWVRSSLGASALLSGVDYPISNAGYNYGKYVSGGFIQFYPNPIGTTLYPPGINDISFTQVNKVFQTNAYGQHYYLNQYMGYPGNENSLSATTAGGVCVIAANNSIVNAQNVNYPCGWWNASSIIYDISGSNGLCDRLFIWEIKDNSMLNASFQSVSGVFPESAGYFGPPGAWKTAAGVFVSSAPVGTPDTSSLSILDYYGQCSSNPYGKSTQQNFGPFRLYFSVDPVSNWLVTTSLNDFGLAPQVFAQGYQCSGDLVAPGTVSSQYTSVLMRNASNNIVASGFYYGSSIMCNPDNIRAILDESAGDTFANARHCTVGKSGLAKVVYIYFPYTDTPGGDSASNSVKNKGIGFRSVNTFDLERKN